MIVINKKNYNNLIDFEIYNFIPYVYIKYADNFLLIYLFLLRLINYYLFSDKLVILLKCLCKLVFVNRCSKRKISDFPLLTFF